MSRDIDPRSTSVAVPPPDRKKGGGWFPFLLAGLIALLAVVAAVSLLGGGDDDDTDRQASVATTAAAPSAAPVGGSSVGAPSDGGTLRTTTDDGDVLVASASGAEDLVGQDARGTGLTVVDVVEGEGFVVATGPDAPSSEGTYVEFGGGVGEDEPRRGLPSVGDEVDLKGPVRPAPDDPASTLRLTDEVAAVVERQGLYVNADSIDVR